MKQTLHLSAYLLLIAAFPSFAGEEIHIDGHNAYITNEFPTTHQASKLKGIIQYQVNFRNKTMGCSLAVQKPAEIGGYVYSTIVTKRLKSRLYNPSRKRLEGNRWPPIMQPTHICNWMTTLYSERRNSESTPIEITLETEQDLTARYGLVHIFARYSNGWDSAPVELVIEDRHPTSQAVLQRLVFKQASTSSRKFGDYAQTTRNLQSLSERVKP